MGTRYLGYLSDHRLSLYEIGSSEWAPIQEFEGTDSAGELAEYLPRDRPLHLLADLVEMEFRLHQVPLLRGADRRTLHERKLAQVFRATPYRHAFSHGRTPGGVREESLIMSAITNPDLLEPWISPLRRRRFPLSGIASAPVLLAPLAEVLATDNPHLLLVTAQGHGGIRLTHFARRKICFSRLAARPGQGAPPGEALLDEITRTHQYLLSHRLIESDSPVDVVCLAPERLMESWRHLQPAAEGFEFRHIGLQEAAQLAGIKSARAWDSTEHLLIALLLKSRFPNHLAPALERRSHQVLRARKGLQAASGVTAATAALAIVILIHGAQVKRQAALLAETAAIAIDRQTEQVRQSLPDSDATAGEIREALTLARALYRENAPSRLLLADISRGLEAVPAAQLNRLSWGRTGRPEDISDSSLFSEAGGPAPPPDPGPSRHWVAMVSGEMVGIGGYREANAAVDGLGMAIRRDKIDVQVLRYPFNVRPDRELQEEDLGNPAAARQPFQLRVLWKK